MLKQTTLVQTLEMPSHSKQANPAVANFPVACKDTNKLPLSTSRRLMWTGGTAVLILNLITKPPWEFSFALYFRGKLLQCPLSRRHCRYCRSVHSVHDSHGLAKALLCLFSVLKQISWSLEQAGFFLSDCVPARRTSWFWRSAFALALQ